MSAVRFREVGEYFYSFFFTYDRYLDSMTYNQTFDVELKGTSLIELVLETYL